MSGYLFDGLYTHNGWIMPAYVSLSDSGKLISIATEPSPNFDYNRVRGYAIPGFVNAHSHAFQYAMAGLTENRSIPGQRDNFWTWRQIMYDIALRITPDQMEHIACKLYAEMIRHGYTHVCEFHYLHHALDGSPYSNLAEMSERLISAAKRAGIGITLIPIFYHSGGFGTPALPEQRRFISNDTNAYLKLWHACESASNEYAQAKTAVGLHSLRAVPQEMILECLQSTRHDLPVHIHISEQKKEVEDSVAYFGQRPVEWLTDKIPIGPNWHLIHATHINDSEIQALTSLKAQVVLCPSTEANLGDGIFPLKKYMKQNGNWCLGTDSHISLNVFEELRLLDYGQRLISHDRHSFSTGTQVDSAGVTLNKLFSAGRRSAGMDQQTFYSKGQGFDALVMDANQTLFSLTSPENLLDTIIYSSDPSMYLGTIIHGKWCVHRHEHINHSEIDENFQKAVKSLNIR